MHQTFIVQARRKPRHYTRKDDVTMADEMIVRSEFLEYMQAFEERLDNRFSEVRHGFNGVDQRLDKVDQRLDKVDERLDRVDQRLDRVDQRLDQVDLRFDRVDQQFKQVDQQFKQVDQQFKQVDRRFEQIDRRLEQIDRRFEQIDPRFGHLDTRFDQMEERSHGLEQQMKVQFEETRGLIRLSLEGLEALRETTDRGFDDMRRENRDNKALFEAALKYVRTRVERVETSRPAKRRR